MTPQQHFEWLRARHSVRRFRDEPVARAVLERLVEAATTAPSSTNRQPWRFAVVTAKKIKAQIVEAVRERTENMTAIIKRGHHAEEFGRYGDFFFEPLAAAPAVIIPQYRPYPDLIASFIRSGGGDPSKFETADAMQAELCSTSAAIMTLLLQAHAEGLGACWMAGPMVARGEVQRLLDIHDPWRMVGAIALGHPAAKPEARERKPLEKVITWFEDEHE